MAVWDRWANESLKAIKRTPEGPRHHYKNYLEIVVDLVDAMQKSTDSHKVIPREVDLALFHAGQKAEVLEQLRRAANND